MDQYELLLKNNKMVLFSVKSSQEEDEEDSIDLRKTDLVRSTQVRKLICFNNLVYISTLTDALNKLMSAPLGRPIQNAQVT